MKPCARLDFVQSGFNAAIKKQIGEKEGQYDALVGNLSSGALPSEVVADIGQRMKALKDEMEALRETTPPQDFTTEQITAWLELLKADPDDRAIHLLIERIDVKTKTDFSITSTLKSVLGENGCGGWT